MPPQGNDVRYKGIRYLRRRIMLFPAAIAITLLGTLVVPLINEASNQKKAHTVTLFCAFFNIIFWCILSGLTYKLRPSISNPREVGYAAIKLWLHICVVSLVTLSFSLSLMMRMNKAATITTLVVAVLFVAHRWWKCRRAALDTDVDTYRGLEEVIQHLIELSTMATTTVLGAWFSSAFFYFQNYPEEEHDAWLLPSQYLAFFISVAASLALLKSIARSGRKPLWEILVLMYGLYMGLVVLALVIGASRVGRYRWYAPLALVPEAVALVVWLVLRLKHEFPNRRGHHPFQQHQEAPRDDVGRQDQDEQPPPHEAVAIGAFGLVMVLVSYSAKSVSWALSTVYDEVFVISVTGAVVGALGWRLLTQPPIPARAPGVRAAAKTLAWFAVIFVAQSLIMLFGIIVHLVRRGTDQQLMISLCSRRSCELAEACS